MNNYAYDEFKLKIELQNKEKSERFKERIAEFANVSTLEEAKELAKQILRLTDKDIYEFNIGNSTCVVVNKDDMFRISLNSRDEFISYDFA